MWGHAARARILWTAAVSTAVALSCGDDTESPSGGAAGRGGTTAPDGASGSGGSGPAGSAGASGAGGFAGGPQLNSKRLDLLLVVDNSISMADKQEVLRQSAAPLIERLTNPRCIDANGKPVPAASQPSIPAAACPAGSRRELEPVTDMHVGVITSSLGGHGADLCSPAEPNFNPTRDDKARLITRGIGGTSVPTYQSLGFLKWDPTQSASPPGANNATELADQLAQLIVGAGQVGCGFEATLEAWYRFLIDPEPPLTIRRNANTAVVEGVDSDLLAQRAAFLRPDSAVAVLMLTDENDCSIRDGGSAWIVGQISIGSAPFQMPRATSICATDPNDVCCRTCGLSEMAPPAGCTALMSDPECAKGAYDALGDRVNLRCFDQKRRFGLDFLYPLERYVEGLSAPQVANRAGQRVPNPLYSDLTGGSAAPRDRSLITLAAIVGVPWQDIARDPANTTELSYMSAAELAQNGRWQMIAGDSTRYIPPSDPFARESVDPRMGTNPVTGEAISPPTATALNPINGHEYNIADRTDLQYSCIFPLRSPRECVGGVSPCECDPTLYPGWNKPICAGTRQTHAKAYPPTRHLSLLSKLSTAAVVGSICARNVTEETRPDYAYAPAVQALIERLSVILK